MNNQDINRLEKLSLTIEGTRENDCNAEIDDFLNITGGILALLKKIVRQHYKNKSEKIPKCRFLLTNLSHNSPAQVEIAIKPLKIEHMYFSPTNKLGEILRDINECKADYIPNDYIDSLMSTVEPIRNKRIHKAKVKLNGGESEFRFFDINSNFVENLDKESKKEVSDYTTIEGKIEMVQLHTSEYFKIYSDLESAPPVSCSFSNELKPKVIGLIDRRATVYGRAWYRPKSYHPNRMNVEKITPLALGERPDMKKLKGAFDITGGLSVEEYMKSIRNE